MELKGHPILIGLAARILVWPIQSIAQEAIYLIRHSDP